MKHSQPDDRTSKDAPRTALETLAVEWALQHLSQLRKYHGDDPAEWEIDINTWGEGWYDEDDQARDYAQLNLMTHIQSHLGIKVP